MLRRQEVWAEGFIDNVFHSPLPGVWRGARHFTLEKRVGCHKPPHCIPAYAGFLADMHWAGKVLVAYNGLLPNACEGSRPASHTLQAWTQRWDGGNEEATALMRLSPLEPLFPFRENALLWQDLTNVWSWLWYLGSNSRQYISNLPLKQVLM